MPRNETPLPQDGLYRAILTVLALSTVIGVILALVAEYLYPSVALSGAAAGMALASAAIYFVFRWLGRREMQKRADRDGPRDPPDPPS